MAAKSTAATGQNFSMFAGDQIALSIPIRDEAGEPVALPGAVGHWYLIAQKTGAVVLHKSVGGLIPDVDGVYVLRVEFDQSDTADLVGSFDHMARILDGDGRLLTVTTGIAQIARTPALA